MKHFLGVAAVLLALFSTAASATTPLPLVWCDNCTTVQKQAAAKATNVQDSIVYVADLGARTTQAFHVWVDADDTYNPPRTTRRADPQSTGSPYFEMGNALIRFYYDSPVGWRKALSLSYPVNNVNVYNVAVTSAEQNDMTDYMSNHVGVMMNEVSSNLIMMGNTFKLIDSSKVPAIVITVNFSDGSHIDILCEYTTTNPTFKPVTNSGRDSHNNTVLSRASPDPIKVRFNSVGNVTDEANFIQHMNLLGYIGFMGGGGGGNTDTFSCKMSGGGQAPITYKCERGI